MKNILNQHFGSSCVEIYSQRWGLINLRNIILFSESLIKTISSLWQKFVIVYLPINTYYALFYQMLYWTLSPSASVSLFFLRSFLICSFVFQFRPLLFIFFIFQDIGYGPWTSLVRSRYVWLNNSFINFSIHYKRELHLKDE